MRKAHAAATLNHRLTHFTQPYPLARHARDSTLLYSAMYANFPEQNWRDLTSFLSIRPSTVQPWRPYPRALKTRHEVSPPFQLQTKHSREGRTCFFQTGAFIRHNFNRGRRRYFRSIVAINPDALILASMRSMFCQHNVWLEEPAFLLFAIIVVIEASSRHGFHSHSSTVLVRVPKQLPMFFFMRHH